MIYAFGDCTLNVVLYELRRNGEVLHVEPQVFDVLLYLLRHRLEVVSREELLEAVWGDGFVTEATLNSRIMAVRKAIGDDGRTQQLIKTVRGRGFRFVGAVEERDELHTHNERTDADEDEAGESTTIVGLSSPASTDALNTLPTFGRATEMRHLRQRLKLSLAGQRQLIFLTGEAGIGKTTLLQTLLAEAKTQGELWVLQGQCLDQHGVGEPYMPLLSALGQLCREPHGDRVTALLMQCAPTWLVQMPSLVGQAELELLQQRTLGATRERMLREMVETLETMSAERALLLVLEDLHWSDHATLDLLSWLARRPEAARLMMIGTYRPADAAAGGHPLRALAQELRIRGYCAELALSSLSDQAISEYLQARFPGLEDVHQLAAVVHRRTGGNPLFMYHIVEAWCDAGHLSPAESSWNFMPLPTN
jgi:DNA-binding winged helix-turn-helix (wHTH) protein